MKRFLVIIIPCVCFLLGTLLTQYSKSAQPSQVSEGASSQVLIQEIRSLRRALQDFTVNNSRVQFALERCRMQQLSVDRASEEYSSVQTQIDSNEELIKQSEESVKNMEQLLKTEDDSLHREEIERDRKSIITNIELYKQRSQRLEERRVQIAGSLQAEKAKLSELKEILDSLDRTFANQQSERK